MTMFKLWTLAGRIAFWVLWPAFFVYLRFGKRTRVIISAEDKVLLVKGWLARGQWLLPGGGIHSRETREQGAVREVREETGLKLKPNQLNFMNEGQAREYGLSFTRISFWTQLPGAATVARQHRELVDVAWLPARGILLRDDVSPDTKQILRSCPVEALRESFDRSPAPRTRGS